MTVVTIALPIWQERISPVLDTATRLLVLTCQDGQETGRSEIALPQQPPEALARMLAEMQLDLLLCGALSHRLHLALNQQALRVWPHLCGEVEAILHAFCQGRLTQKEFRIPGCHKHHGADQCRRKGHSRVRAAVTRAPLVPAQHFPVL